MQIKNTTTAFDVWSLPNTRTTTPNKWGNKRNVVAIIGFLGKIIDNQNYGFSELIVLVVYEKVHDVVVVVNDVVHFIFGIKIL